PLAPAQLEHAAIVGVPLDAHVRAEVVVLTIGVAFAVLLVVLLFVADEVGEREAVVRGDEVDAGVGAPAALLVEVAAAGETRRQLGDRTAIAAPETAHRVAGLAVPLRPPGREVADSIAAF